MTHLLDYLADRVLLADGPVGTQVQARNLYESPRTFRWMKRYIARRSPVKVNLDGREISHLQAGRDFLTAVLTFAAAELKLGDEEVAFTAPVEAYEQIRQELAKFSPALAAKPELVVANKLDVSPEGPELAQFAAALGRPVLGISGVAGWGLEELINRLWDLLQTAPKAPVAEPAASDLEACTPWRCCCGGHEAGVV